MTNIQAIDLLKGLEQSLDDYCELNDEGKTAFGMAITALELFGNSEQLESGHEKDHVADPGKMVGGLISRQEAIDAINKAFERVFVWDGTSPLGDKVLENVPSAQPERLTDDDFETIRIHLNAYKEKLCNQQRWKEAEEYQRIIDRFMAFASAQPEPFVDAEKLKRCRFEYINACKIVARPTPDTSKNDIYDANAVIKALHPIFGDAEF